MLIVARRKGQRIRIGDNIEVVVTEVSRGEVRLGIVAPKQIPVLREEMVRAVADANRAAMASSIEESASTEEVSVVTELKATLGNAETPAPSAEPASAIRATVEVGCISSSSGRRTRS